MKITIGIIIALAVAAGAWFFFMPKDTLVTETPSTNEASTDVSNTQESPTQAQTASAPTGKGSGSLDSIYSRSGNYTCTFETINSSVKTVGTIYVSGGKTRSDLSTSVAGITTEIHNIFANSYGYTWIGGQQTGFKTYIGATAKSPTNSIGAGFDGDVNSQISWDCHPWLPAAAQFAVPTNITFVTQ